MIDVSPVRVICLSGELMEKDGFSNTEKKSRSPTSLQKLKLQRREIKIRNKGFVLKVIKSNLIQQDHAF